MKAAIYEGGRTIRVGESHPIPPGKGEVRLEVAYCGICGTDMHIFQGHMDKRVKAPLPIGHEVSAKVVELGEGVDSIAAGDRVAVRPLFFGNPEPFDHGYPYVGKNLKVIGIDLPGGMQGSWTVPAYTLHRLPSVIDMKQGAMIEPVAVACHDVRLGSVQAGETCVVIGGGPIGLLIALVAREKGAHVIISEPIESRLKLAASLGLAGVNPINDDLVEAVRTATGGRMADCVFEVSGSASGVEVMTELPHVRGRIVMVAIHAEPRPVNLFKFFFSELKLIGARLYEEVDFEEAIRLSASGSLPLEKLITEILPIDEVQQTFEALESHPDGIKYLINCQS